MAKLICLVGLPASGKTTKAAALLQEYLNAFRINRDALRTMLHCDVWSDRKEDMTRQVAHVLARHLLRSPQCGVVIIDDTNLSPRTIASWQLTAKEALAQCEIIQLDIPVEECLRRDALRENPVGRHVIIGMALQYGLYPKPQKGFVLCDLDGTLADTTHRQHFVEQEPKDWDGFFRAMGDDPVRVDVLQQIVELWGAGHPLVFVSGRPETYRGATERWLQTVTPWVVPFVFMRRAGDHRPDTVVKAEMLRTYWPDTSWIHCVLDDRPSVIREVWQAAGIQVIDCGNGREF